MANATTTNVNNLQRGNLTAYNDGSGITGSFTCNGTTAVVVSEPRLTAGHSIIITLRTAGGTVGATPFVSARVNGTSFSTVGTASNTSVYDYKLI